MGSDGLHFFWRQPLVDELRVQPPQFRKVKIAATRNFHMIIDIHEDVRLVDDLVAENFFHYIF